jgi:hypothetical protein
VEDASAVEMERQEIEQAPGSDDTLLQVKKDF